MAIDERLLEVRQYTDIGYRPIVDFGAWRVAVLNFIDELLPERLGSMQRHDETDEVFVLLRGRCILFLGEGQDAVTRIHAQDLSARKAYNVKRGAWHTHTLSEDAMVLIIENVDTSDRNSPHAVLSHEHRLEIVRLTRSLWR